MQGLKKGKVICGAESLPTRDSELLTGRKGSMVFGKDYSDLQGNVRPDSADCYNSCVSLIVPWGGPS